MGIIPARWVLAWAGRLAGTAVRKPALCVSRNEFPVLCCGLVLFNTFKVGRSTAHCVGAVLPSPSAVRISKSARKACQTEECQSGSPASHLKADLLREVVQQRGDSG
mmetsp:Transcript_34082/g.67078  ORF Transcript_34082/g.67078 Transcript_34082/m.67078 type:complete len:107 (-) Transcript_34082:22-342(-)